MTDVQLLRAAYNASHEDFYRGRGQPMTFIGRVSSGREYGYVCVYAHLANSAVRCGIFVYEPVDGRHQARVLQPDAWHLGNLLQNLEARLPANKMPPPSLPDWEDQMIWLMNRPRFIGPRNQPIDGSRPPIVTFNADTGEISQDALDSATRIEDATQTRISRNADPDWMQAHRSADQLRAEEYARRRQAIADFERGRQRQQAEERRIRQEAIAAAAAIAEQQAAILAEQERQRIAEKRRRKEERKQAEQEEAERRRQEGTLLPKSTRRFRN